MVLFRITENEPSKMHNVGPYVYSRPWGYQFYTRNMAQDLQVLPGMAYGSTNSTWVQLSGSDPRQKILVAPPPLGCNGKMLLIKYIKFEHFLWVWGRFQVHAQFAPIVAFHFRRLTPMNGSDSDGQEEEDGVVLEIISNTAEMMWHEVQVQAVVDDAMESDIPQERLPIDGVTTEDIPPSILNNQRVVKVAHPTSQKQIAVISKQTPIHSQILSRMMAFLFTLGQNVADDQVPHRFRQI